MCISIVVLRVIYTLTSVLFDRDRVDFSSDGVGTVGVRGNEVSQAQYRLLMLYPYVKLIIT